MISDTSMNSDKVNHMIFVRKPLYIHYLELAFDFFLNINYEPKKESNK